MADQLTSNGKARATPGWGGPARSRVPLPPRNTGQSRKALASSTAFLPLFARFSPN